MALALILVLRRISRKIPGPLIALVLGIVAVKAFDLEALRGERRGRGGNGVPMPSLPSVPISTLPTLALGALGIVFLAVGESVGAGRAYAAKHKYAIDADQEMVAIGAANLAAACSAGSRPMRACPRRPPRSRPGAQAQLASLVTSGLILATARPPRPLFAESAERRAGGDRHRGGARPDGRRASCGATGRGDGPTS